MQLSDEKLPVNNKQQERVYKTTMKAVSTIKHVGKL